MKKRKQPTTWYGKAWHFLWHSDSIWAWLLNVVVAFLLIRFVIFPVAGLIMGTPLPVVAVVSSSMDHGPVNGVLCGESVSDAEFWDICGEWYESRGISQEAFADFPLKRGFDKGDVIVLWRSNLDNTEVGDIIVFPTRKPYPIIHRIVAVSDGPDVKYTTKGDHNEDSIQEYGLWDGRVVYTCYRELQNGVAASLCGPGTLKVGPDTPGAIELLDETAIDADDVIGKAVFRIPWAGWLKIGFVELLSALGLGNVATAVSL